MSSWCQIQIIKIIQKLIYMIFQTSEMSLLFIDNMFQNPGRNIWDRIPTKDIEEV